MPQRRRINHQDGTQGDTVSQRIHRTRQSELTDEPANNNPAGGIKPGQSDEQQYSSFRDARLVNALKQGAVYVGIILVTGKLMEWVVDKYVIGPSSVGVADLKNDAEARDRKALFTGEAESLLSGSVSLYKSERSVDEELANLRSLQPADLKLHQTFFGKGKTYFIQVVGAASESANADGERMSPHYYFLKKLCRKKGVPMFPFKINVRDFEDEATWPLLRQALNVESAHELADTSYVLVNEDKMKLPQSSDGADVAISSKFIQNVLQVGGSLDELYDLFDLHKGEAHKFVCMLKDPRAEPKDFSLQNKMFRKFFYENSAPVEDLLTFVEVTSPRLAAKLGLT